MLTVGGAGRAHELRNEMERRLKKALLLHPDRVGSDTEQKSFLR